MVACQTPSRVTYFSLFYLLFLPTRGAGLIAVRPTDCTKGGVEEQAGCRMKCEGCCVGWWESTIPFFICVCVRAVCINSRTQLHCAAWHVK
ncbi:hypothetical protein TCDM_13344 [Trypanosoma cruzi Dm28c]|uniref:Secreted protein n=1 Tax=Trypanosoma cruzi Dm28c TaxID=1416333 RepID=V5CIL9_TRYCR|nr:hypothetical protein TCDM_13344 [Trypanosoma cruzi Dm28c]